MTGTSLDTGGGGGGGGWRRAEWLAAAVAVACFVNVLPNDFCDDGIPIVQHNNKVNEPGQWGAIWTTDYWSDAKLATPNRDLLYRPVALSSYRVMRGLGVVSAWPHHVVNILLHALVTGLIVRMCRPLGGTVGVGLVAGLIFAVLPIHTGVLNNVVGRADLLAAGAILIALMCHERFVNAAKGANRVRWIAGASLAAFVAMGAKESGVTVVAIIPLFDLFLRWNRRKCEGRSFVSFRLQSLFRLAYVVVPAMCYVALRYHALGGQFHQKPALTKTVNVLVDAPVWQHALGVVQLWGMYWAKTLWPGVLSVNYSINAIRLATSPLDPHVLVGVAVTVALVLFSIRTWRQGHRGVALAVAAIAVSYFPTSNALVLIQVFVAERIWYLPSVWVAVVGGFALAQIPKRPAWIMAGCVILCGMAARCWIRNTEWRHNGTLYAAAYRDHPEAIGARYHYGRWLAFDSGDPDALPRGIEILIGAVEMDPGSTDSQRVLGRAYLTAGAWELAAKHLQIADMHVPGHPPTVELLAYASERLRERHSRQLDDLEQRAEADPDDIDGQLALVRRLREVGRADESLAKLKQHDERFADSFEWQSEYAVVLVYLNLRDEAIQRYRRCLAIRPDATQLTIELAMLLVERREGPDLDEAQRLADRAAKLAPDATPVLICQAELRALKGDLRGAVRLYQRAIRALPLDSEQRRTLEHRARTLGGD